MLRRDRLAALLVVVSLPLGARDLARSSLSGGRSLDYARQLTAIGPRLTGTAAYERAAEWAVARFHDMGLPRVAREPVAIGRGWERVSASARIVAPQERGVRVESLGWSPSTPEGGFDAEVVALDSFSIDLLSRQPLQGRIVLLPDGDPPGDSSIAGGVRRRFGVALRNAGALAMLSPDSGADNVLNARGFGFGTDLAILPAAQLGRDDAQAIRGLLARGPVRMSLELRNRVTPGAATADNVIADLSGGDRAGEWVIVGAHLDSWDFATGAQDNATGVAMVLEAARAIASLKQPPRRSIRFALWAGEEQGQLGSNAYVEAHATELDRVVAVVNTDAGTGRVIGWTSPGRSDVVRGVVSLTREFLADLGAGTFDESLRYAFQSDGAAFILAGIPTLDLNSDDAVYEEIHHTAADTMDRVDAHNLAVGAAAVAATAYAIADAPARIAPRLDRRAVARMRKNGE
jgi:carboxypeptidase Q